MKKVLMSVVTASALVMLSGCNVVDEIKSILKTNVVYVVNATAGDITIDVSKKTSSLVKSMNLEATFYPLTGEDSYDVSYNDAHNTNFSAGSVYLYAATTCNNKGYLRDKVDANRVHIVNLSGQAFNGEILVTDTAGNEFVISENISTCNVVSTSQANGMKIGNGMKLKLSTNPNSLIVKGISPKVEALAQSVKVDFIIYPNNTATLVPMAGYDDLF